MFFLLWLLPFETSLSLQLSDRLGQMHATLLDPASPKRQLTEPPPRLPLLVMVNTLGGHTHTRSGAKHSVPG